MKNAITRKYDVARQNNHLGYPFPRKVSANPRPLMRFGWRTALVAIAAAVVCFAPVQTEAAYSGSGTFNLITGTGDITSGGYYVFVGPSSFDYLMESSSIGTATHALSAVAVTILSSAIVNPSVGQVWKMDSVATGYSIYNEAGSIYVGHAATVNVFVKSAAASASQFHWTFATATTAGLMEIRNVGSTLRILQYNSATSTRRFAPYSSAQNRVRVFKLVVPAITLADNGTQVGASNIVANTTANILHKFSLAVATANATLTAVGFTSAGTYTATDISNFKVWYSTDNALNTGADTLLGTISSSLGTGAHTLSSLTQVINSGSTGYIFITTDIASAASTNGVTIYVSPAVGTADVTFSAGTKSGSTTAGGAQTILAAEPTSHATSLSFTAVSGTQMTVNWSSGNGENRIVVVKSAGAVSWAPTDGTAPSGVNADFTVATDQGSANKICYNGNSTSFTLTGLTGGTTYYVKIFEYKGSSSGVNYYTGGTPLNGNQTAAASCTPAPAVTYVQQVGNYSNWFVDAAGGCGYYNNGGTEVGLYAHVNGAKQVAGWRPFRTDGSGGGTPRELQVGDRFQISVHGWSPYGGLGCSINDGAAVGSWANRINNTRGYIQCDNYGDLYVTYNGSTASWGGVKPCNSTVTFEFDILSTKEFTANISGQTPKYDLTMMNSPDDTMRVDGYSIYFADDYQTCDGASAHDSFWKQNTLVTNLGYVVVGADNGTRTIAGKITDGQNAACTNAPSANRLRKAGSGTVSLGNTNNTFSGDTAIEGGTLAVGDDGALGTKPGALSNAHIKVTAAGGALVATNTFTLDSNRGVLLTGWAYIGVAAGKTLTYNGVINDAASSLNIVKNQDGTLVLGGNNTFDGGLYIDQGTQTLMHASAAGTGLIALGRDSGTESAALSLGAAITVANVFTCRTESTGTKYICAPETATMSGAGGFGTGDDECYIDVAATKTLTMSGVIGGTGGGEITKKGSGILYMSNAANVHDKKLTVEAGTLQVAASRNLGADPAAVYADKLTLNGGTLNATASFTMNRYYATTLGASHGTINVADTYVLTYDSVISGAGNLSKTGNGTLVLTNVNTYGGTTTISAGTNVVNGTASSSAHTVAAGACLRGVGTVGSLVANGIINPGNLTYVASNLNCGTYTLGSGGGQVVDIATASGTAGTDWDQVTASGAITVNGSGTFTIYVKGTATGFDANKDYTWKIMKGASVASFDVARFSVVSTDFTPGLDSGTFTVAQSGNDIYLLFIALVDPPAAFDATAGSVTNNVLSFTRNSAGTDIIILYDTDGTFDAPSGTAGAVGDVFAGGTVLYKGAASPQSHNLLLGCQTVYYKCWSYTNTRYSATGLTDNQATPSVAPPTGLYANPTNATDFTARWIAALGATNYLLDVSTNATFGGEGGGGNILNVTFEGWAAVPADWSENSSAIQNNSSLSHGGTYCESMNAAADWICTPIMTNLGTLSFWVRTSSDPGDWTLTVQTSPDKDTWTTQGVVVESGAGGAISDTYIQTNMPVNLVGTNYIRWYMTARTADSVYIDDVLLSSGGGGAGDMITHYTNRIAGATTSLSVTGLTSGVTYYYRVQAQGVSCSSGESLTGTVTTIGGVAPPVINPTIRFMSFDGTTNDTWYYKGSAGIDYVCLDNTTNATGVYALKFTGSSGGGTDPAAVFDNVDLTGMSNATLSVGYACNGADSDDDLYLDLSYDNGANWTVSHKLVDGNSGFDLGFGAIDLARTTNANPFTVAIPNTERQVRMRIRYDEAAGLDNTFDRYWVDNIKITATGLVYTVMYFGTNETVASEDGSVVAIPVKISAAAGATVSVFCAGSAVLGTDYTLSATTIVFNGGATVSNLYVTFTDDSDAEGPELGRFWLTQPRGARVGGPDNSTLFIRDDNSISIMAANLSGGTSKWKSAYAYPPESESQLRLLRPDVVAIQEWNIRSNTSYRAFVTENFGADFSYYVVTNADPNELPNGIISRWGITVSNAWEDNVGYRQTMHSEIDLPGAEDLQMISVHFRASDEYTTSRWASAQSLTSAVAAAAFPAGDYMAIAGDLNLSNRTELCMQVLTQIVKDAHIPKDALGRTNTNVILNRPYDVVLPNAVLEANHVSYSFNGTTYADGMIFDTRLCAEHQFPALWAYTETPNVTHRPVMKVYSLLPPVNPPAAFAATVASAAQINLTFTRNAASDNVIIVYNATGVFTDPSGAAGNVGDPFVGGTILYKGGVSPVNHTSLLGCQRYYYKCWSYNGARYSTGLTDDDTTTAVAAPTAIYVNPTNASSITINWTAAAGATNYWLDMAISNTFVSGSGTQTNLVQYGFPASDALLPTYVGGVLTASMFTVSSGAIESNITTGTYFPNEPYIEESTGWGGTTWGGAKYFVFTIYPIGGNRITITGITYKAYATAAGPSAFSVDINNAAWTNTIDAPDSLLLTNILAVTGVADKTAPIIIKILGWNNGSRATTGTGVFRLDDVQISGVVAGGGSGGTFLTGFENLMVTGTSYTVNGLTDNFTYYYRIRSGAACTSPNSATQTITTVGGPAGIAVKGTNDEFIVSGETPPSSDKGTAFRGIAVSDGALTNVFTVQDDGVGTLNLQNLTIGGTHAADFSIVTQPSLTVSPGGSSIFKIKFDPSGVGLRSATVYITNNVAGENPFTFDISGSGEWPWVYRLPATIAASASVGGDPANQGFGVTNIGIGTLNYVVTTNAAWMTISPVSGSFTNRQSQQHTVDFITTGLATGVYNGTITLTDANASNSPATIAVTLTLNPISDPTAGTATADGNELIDLAWTPHGSYATVMVLHKGSAISTDPTNGCAYSVGNNIAGAVVLYKGTGTALEHIVPAGSANYYKFYSVSGNYYSPGVADDVTTESYLTNEIVEVFAYTNNTTLAQGATNSGKGWSSGWTGLLDQFTNTAGSFATQANYPGNAANKVVTRPGAGNTNKIMRAFPAVTSGKIFAAYIMNYEWAGAQKWAGASLMDGTTEKIFFGECYGGDGILGVGLTTGTKALTAGSGNDYIVIMRYDYSTDDAHVNAYKIGTDTVPTVEPGSWDATNLNVGGITSLNGIMLQAGCNDGVNTPGRIYYDEVRVATTWAGLMNIVVTTPTATNYVINGGANVTDAAVTGGTFSVVLDLYDIAGIEITNVAAPFYKPNFDLINSAGTEILQDKVFDSFIRQGGRSVLASNTTWAGYFPAVLGSYTSRWSAINSNGYDTVNSTSYGGSGGGGANLAANPGFETGSSASWTTFEADYSVVSSDKHGGTYSVFCNATDTRALAQTIAISPAADGSTPYTISYWYKLTNDTGNGFRRWMSWDTGAGTGSTLQPGTYHDTICDWTYVQLTNTPSAGTASFTCEFRAYNGCDFYLDDVTLSTAGGSGGQMVFTVVDDDTVAPMIASNANAAPLAVQLGSSYIEATSGAGTTNAIYTVNKSQLEAVDGANPLRFVISAYDAGSGLSRGTTDAASQMNVSIGSVFVDNVAQYVSDESTAYASTLTATATSVWKWTSITVGQLGDLTTARTNRIVVDIPDADYESSTDRSWRTNQLVGRLVVIDDTSSSAVIYDSFNGTDATTIGGCSGGAGWSDTWTLGGDAYVNYSAGSFNIEKSCYFNPVFNKIVMLGDVNDRDMTAARTFNRTFTAGRVYFSWMQNTEFTGGNTYAGVSLLQTGTEKAFVGKVYADDKLGIDSSTHNKSSTVTLSQGTGNDYVIVAMFDFATRELSATSYKSTTEHIAEEPRGYWQVTTTQTVGHITSLDGLRFAIGAGAGVQVGDVYMDEIRVGTNWFEVVRKDGVAQGANMAKGPTPKLLYVGTNYLAANNPQGNTNNITVTDKDLVNASRPLDFAVQWSSDYGVFLTNANGTWNFDSRQGRVQPNWDPVLKSGSGASAEIGYDDYFTNFIGVSGANVVTTYVHGAFNITNATYSDLFYMTLSAENNNTNSGGSIAAVNGADAVPYYRGLTINSNLQFYVQDNDTEPPEFGQFTVNAMGAYGSSNIMAGGIAIVGINGGPQSMAERFSFVVLSPFPEGTIIHFTDCGWSTTNDTWHRLSEFHTNKWIAVGNADIGQVFELNLQDLNTGGDQVTVYQYDGVLAPSNDSANVRFVYAVNCASDTNVWLYDPLGASNTVSCIYRGLTNGLSAVGIPNAGSVNVIYTGTVSGSGSALLSSISDSRNWQIVPNTTDMNITNFHFDITSAGGLEWTVAAVTDGEIGDGFWITNIVRDIGAGLLASNSAYGSAPYFMLFNELGEVLVSNQFAASYPNGYRDWVTNTLWVTNYTGEAINLGVCSAMVYVCDADYDRSGDYSAYALDLSVFITDDDVDPPLVGPNYVTMAANATDIPSLAVTQALACWNFNTDGLPSYGTGNMLSNLYEGVSSAAGSTINAYSGDAAGNDLTIANWTNNGRYIQFTISMQGFKNLQMSMAARRSNLGYTDNDIAYSVNGLDFTDIETGWNPVDGTWTLKTVDFSSATVLNNSPVVNIRITLGGGTATGSIRIDNLTFKAEPIRYFEVNDSVLRTLGAGSPLAFTFNMYDPTSGLRRANSGSAQYRTHVNIDGIATNNLSYYVAAKSSADSQIASSTSRWEFTDNNLFSFEGVSALYADGLTNRAIRANIADFDFDRNEVDMRWASNTLFGFLRVTDEDTNAPAAVLINKYADHATIDAGFAVVTNNHVLRSDEYVRGHARREGSDTNVVWSISDADLTAAGTRGLQFAFAAQDALSGIGRGTTGNTNTVMSFSVGSHIANNFANYSVGLSSPAGAGAPLTNVWTFTNGFMSEIVVTAMMAATVSGPLPVSIRAPDTDNDRTNDAAILANQRVGSLRVYDDDRMGPVISTVYLPTNFGGAPIFVDSFETNQGWPSASVAATAMWTNNVASGTWIGRGISQTTFDPKVTGTRRIGFHTNTFNNPWLQLPPVTDPGSLYLYAQPINTGSGDTTLRVERADGGSWVDMGSLAITNTALDDENNFEMFTWDIDLAGTYTLRVVRTDSGTTVSRSQIFADDFRVTKRTIWQNETNIVLAWSPAVDDYSGVDEYRYMAPSLAPVRRGASINTNNGVHVDNNVTSLVMNIGAQGILTGYVFAVDNDADRNNDRAVGSPIPVNLRIDRTRPNAPAAFGLLASGYDDETEVGLTWTPPGHDNLSPWQSYRVYWNFGDHTLTTNDNYYDVMEFPGLGNRVTNRVVVTNLIGGQDYFFAVAGKDEAGNLGDLSSVTNVMIGFLTVTQGVRNSATKLRLNWTGSAAAKTYDVIHKDGTAYSDILTNSTQWTLLGRTNVPVFVDETPNAMGDNLRFYRVTYLDRWNLGLRKKASSQIYVGKRIRLYSGRNWISLPGIPDFNTVEYVFGRDLPWDSVPANATRLSWMGRGFNSWATTQQVYLANDGWRWSIIGAGVTVGSVATNASLPNNQSFIVDIPGNGIVTQVFFIGQIPPTNYQPNVSILGGSSSTNRAYTYATFNMPAHIDTNMLNSLRAAGFGGWRGTAPLSDSIWTYNKASQKNGWQIFYRSDLTPPRWQYFDGAWKNYYNGMLKADEGVIIRSVTNKVPYNWYPPRNYRNPSYDLN